LISQPSLSNCFVRKDIGPTRNIVCLVCQLIRLTCYSYGLDGEYPKRNCSGKSGDLQEYVDDELAGWLSEDAIQG
jgi:hypothetical protein